MTIQQRNEDEIVGSNYVQYIYLLRMSYLEKKEITLEFIVIEYSKENMDYLSFQSPQNTKTEMKKIGSNHQK